MYSVLIHEVPAHDSKIRVWCSVSLDIIIGLIFFGDTVIYERCVKLLIFNQLADEE
jgi:hypothetical protein